MKIDFLCRDGSSLGVTFNTLWGKDDRIGVGGSEAAMLTLCSEWSKKGYEVRLYNDPYEQGVSQFEQLPINAFNPDDDRDVLIIFRTPNQLCENAKGMKVWFSCDQYTSVPFREFAPYVDKIVGISDYHAGYFRERYGIDNMIVIDLPLRVSDFDGINVDKIPNRLIHTSVPDRGLLNILAMWSAIRERVPDATIRITSDYRLWGINHSNNENYFSQFMGMEGVIFPYNASLRRKNYLEELCKADILFYPHQAAHAELFCISAAEAQYAGAYPVSSNVGALATTNMGMVIPGNPEDVVWRKQCVNKVVELLTHRDKLVVGQTDVIVRAYERFHPSVVLERWDKEVFI